MMPAAPPVLLHGFHVEADEGAVPKARHTITSLIRGWNVALSEEQVAEVELLSTEVITNAIHHSQATCSVAVRWTGVRVRVEVTDVSPVRPKPRRSSPDAEDGRGLLLVEALAADWGSFYDPVGKVVWFEVASSIRPARREQPPPWSTPGTWAIATTDGAVTSGHLPAWAEDDPTETGVPVEELPQRLAEVNHRNFFEGPMLPLTAPDLWDGVEEDSVFEGSIDCNPYDPDPGLRVPVVNLQVCVGRWILGLDPHGLAEVTAKLHADFLEAKVRPALIAARDDWAATSRLPSNACQPRAREAAHNRHTRRPGPSPSDAAVRAPLASPGAGGCRRSSELHDVTPSGRRAGLQQLAGGPESPTHPQNRRTAP